MSACTRFAHQLPGGESRFAAGSGMLLLALLVVLCFMPSATEAVTREELPLHEIRLPSGFSISVYAGDVPGARSMTLSDRGTLFIGTRNEGNVYAVRDTNGDGTADETLTVLKGLNMPNGVAFRDGSLYVAEIRRILRYDGIEDRLQGPPDPVVVNDSFPGESAHGWKFIAFGPDGLVYVPVGMPCNICRPEDERFGTIMRMKPDGTDLEVFARGIRNTVGFDWSPAGGELWFTDNGADRMGDDFPPDELNRAPRPGMHFGFPYCHAGIPDPEFGAGRDCSGYTPPEMRLGPHVAALGMRFYDGESFPERFRNAIFIAEHGSWNRSIPVGYRIMVVSLREDRAAGYEVFAEGWLRNSGNAWGRPVDVQVMPDGALLVSDDRAGVVYRITYTNR